MIKAVQREGRTSCEIEFTRFTKCLVCTECERAARHQRRTCVTVVFIADRNVAAVKREGARPRNYRRQLAVLGLNKIERTTTLKINFREFVFDDKVVIAVLYEGVAKRPLRHRIPVLNGNPRQVLNGRSNRRTVKDLTGRNDDLGKVAVVSIE